jgi:hypothetical protein
MKSGFQQRFSELLAGGFFKKKDNKMFVLLKITVQLPDPSTTRYRRRNQFYQKSAS